MRLRLLTISYTFLVGLLISIQPGISSSYSSYVYAAEKKVTINTDPYQLRKATHSAADYLVGRCDANGKFVYRINLNPDTPPKPKYNFLRHAGTIYALASYDQVYSRERTKKAIRRASEYLKTSAISFLPERKDLLAVWSHPEMTGVNKSLQAKLGGTGLGLVALLSTEKVLPGTTPTSYLRQMGNFLLFMQKADGSFYSKYIPEEGGRDDSWTSLYYPGEAALGLLMLYEKDPNVVWLQAAADAIAYLTRKRKGKQRVEADHWALLATARLLPLYNRCRKPLPKEAIVGHAVQICESILAAKPEGYSDDSLNGSFMADGRTTPTAIRLEGMLSVLAFLPVEPNSLRNRMIVAIDEGIQFLLRSQIRSGEYAGGIPRAIQKIPENHPGYSKSFNRRATEVRIDYVQHTLSAMLQFEQIFY